MDDEEESTEDSRDEENEEVSTDERIQIEDDQYVENADRFAFLRSDRSWICTVLANLIFAFIMGCVIALVVIYTPIYDFYRPPPFVPPEIWYSVDYLTQEVRYDFYKDKQPIKVAREICTLRNSTLLFFNSGFEEIELDCYLNSRDNAEDRQLKVWLNESAFIGGPPPFQGSVRYSSYKLPGDRPLSFNHINITANFTNANVDNGCDIQKNGPAIWAQQALEQVNSKVTVYDIVKVYGNNGIRSKYSKNGHNGCWNLTRSEHSVKETHNFICRKTVHPSAYATAWRNDPVLSNFTHRHISYSEVYCGIKSLF